MTAIDPNGPADTAMMGIVHDALRRDLTRAKAVLTDGPPPPAQRRAVADHLVWMMKFLHGHHQGEDEAIYPVVRERNPSAAAILDAMYAEHRTVAPAIAAVEAAAEASRYSDASGQRGHLLGALDDLDAVLPPHLRREEDETMPVVSATLTEAELQAIERERFVKPKSFAELGYEGHWLLDGLAPERREVVTGTVPAIPRFILMHGFARSYRRRAAACWGAPARPRRRVQTEGRVELVVDAPPDAVWEVVRDPTRTGEWSHECHEVTWLDGNAAAVAGARFRGRNRTGVFRWGRTCEIVNAEPWEITWRTIPTLLFPDTTDWTIRLHDAGGGKTRIEQSFSGRAPKILEVVYGTLIAAHRDRTEALTADLHRLGAVAHGASITG